MFAVAHAIAIGIVIEMIARGRFSIRRFISVTVAISIIFGGYTSGSKFGLEKPQDYFPPDFEPRVSNLPAGISR